MFFCAATLCPAQDYRLDEGSSTRTSIYERTPFTCEYEGSIYPVLINKNNGRCAIEVEKVCGPNSKNPGKKYKTKKYLSEEQSKDICSKMGRYYTYKPKTKK